MSVKPICPTPKELDSFTFKEFKGKYFKAIKKLAKKHNSQETAAPFFMNLEQKFKDQEKGFFMIFGKLAKWKAHAKQTAVKELGMRGLCYVTFDEADKSLTLHLMPVAGKAKSKDALVAKGMKTVVNPSRCSVEIVQGEFSEDMMDKAADAAEAMEETELDEDAEAMEEATEQMQEKVEAIKASGNLTPEQQKKVDEMKKDIEDIQNGLEKMATVSEAAELQKIDKEIRAIFAKYTKGADKGAKGGEKAESQEAPSAPTESAE